MDLRKIIHELEVEKQRLDEAIIALERLSAGSDGHRANASKASETSGDGLTHETHSEDSATLVSAHSDRK